MNIQPSIFPLSSKNHTPGENNKANMYQTGWENFSWKFEARTARSTEINSMIIKPIKYPLCELKSIALIKFSKLLP